MASMQCFETDDQTYNYGEVQKHASHSSELLNTQTQFTSKTQTYCPDKGLVETQTDQFYSQTETSNPNHNGHFHSKTHGHGHGHGLGLGGHGQSKTQTHSSTNGHGLTQTLGLGHTSSSNRMAASGCNQSLKKRSEHKRGLFQRMKDGLSGGDNSCSSSDSESDDEHCQRRSNC